MKTSLLVAIIICLFSFISACVPTNMATQDKHNLTQRIIEVMDAKVAGDWAKVYTYFDVEYRKKVSVSSFTNRTRIFFDGYSIEKITINEDLKSAEAQVTIDFNAQGFSFRGNKETQIWVYEDNNWYQKLEMKSMFSN